MKRIKKVDPKAAQSIYSFACPCIGECYSCINCGCSSSPNASQTAFNAAKASISTLAQYGLQTINYN